MWLHRLRQSRPRADRGHRPRSFNGPTWALYNQRIPAGETVSFSFTADGLGKVGTLLFSNNMPHLAASGYLFKAWFSEEPGGDLLFDNPYCRIMSPDPNPKELRWTQKTEDTIWKCMFGDRPHQVRTLHLNMEVGCYEGLNYDRCTAGSLYPRDYYIKVNPR